MSPPFPRQRLVQPRSWRCKSNGHATVVLKKNREHAANMVNQAQTMPYFSSLALKIIG
jgi:hypothetical protein